MPLHLDVAIVGAGPYGLSVAAHLTAPGRKVGVFGQPMDTWLRHMPQGMALKSDGFASDLFDPKAALTLAAYCRERGLGYADMGLPVPLETFASYGLWFQEKVAPDLDTRSVIRLERNGGGFGLTLEDGTEVTAAKVVLAVGISHFSHTPPELATLPAALLSHSYDNARPAALAGRHVTVLGGGASAIELAMLLCEAGVDARLVARRAALKFSSHAKGPRPLMAQLRRPTSPLGSGWSSLAFSHAPGLFRYFPDKTRVDMVRRALGPAATGHVRERMEGKVPTLLNHRLIQAAACGERLKLRLADASGAESLLETEHLITATGFRPEVARLAFLAPQIAGALDTVDGAPRLNGGFESTVAGLHFVGLAAANTFGPLQRFACGAGFAARRVRQALS